MLLISSVTRVETKLCMVEKIKAQRKLVKINLETFIKTI